MIKPITIIYDDREKKPWTQEYFGDNFILKKQRLKTGDYTIQGMEKILCVERKDSWEEIASNLSGQNLTRFVDELSRMEKFPLRFLIVESDISAIPRTVQYSQVVTISTLYIWVLKIHLQYGIPIICVGKRHLSKPLIQGLFTEIVEKHKQGSLYYHV